MSDATSQEQDSLARDALLERVRVFVRTLLSDQAECPDISFALAYIATELGLSVANNPVDVFPVVLNALSQAAASVSMDDAKDSPEAISKMVAVSNTTVH